MIFNLNLLHLVALLGAVGCLLLAIPEAGGRSMRASRMFATPTVALLTALVLLFIAFPEPWAREVWAGALVVGLVVGAARGSTMAILVDQVWTRVRLPNGWHTVWIAIALLIGVALEVLFAVVAKFAPSYHVIPGAVVALCAGMLAGRAVAVAIRIPQAPNDERPRF